LSVDVPPSPKSQDHELALGVVALKWIVAGAQPLVSFEVKDGTKLLPI